MPYLPLGRSKTSWTTFGNAPMQAARERNDAANVLVMERHHERGPARGFSVVKPVRI